MIRLVASVLGVMYVWANYKFNPERIWTIHTLACAGIFLFAAWTLGQLFTD